MSDEESGTTYTAAEREILDRVAADRGEEWAEERAELILAQARLVGDLRVTGDRADPLVRSQYRVPER